MKKKEKIKIILDSSCGLSKSQAERKGFLFAPIIIDFNGEERLSGVNIDNKYLYKNMVKGMKIKTASIPLGVITELIREGLEKAEKVFIITISKELSSCNQNAIFAANEFKSDEVFVYDSLIITPWINNLFNEISEFAKEGNQEAIIDLLDRSSKYGIGFISPSNLEFLHSGGRISYSQYLAGSVFKVNPIITVSHGSLTELPVLKPRGIDRASKKIAELTMKAYDHLINEEKIDEKDIEIAILDMNDQEFEKRIRKELKLLGAKKIGLTELSPEMTAHVGPKASGAGIRIKR